MAQAEDDCGSKQSGEGVDDQVAGHADSLQQVPCDQDPQCPAAVYQGPEQWPGRQGDTSGYRQSQADLHQRQRRGRREVHHRERQEDATAKRVNRQRSQQRLPAADVRQAEVTEHQDSLPTSPRLQVKQIKQSTAGGAARAPDGRSSQARRARPSVPYDLPLAAQPVPVGRRPTGQLNGQQSVRWSSSEPGSARCGQRLQVGDDRSARAASLTCRVTPYQSSLSSVDTWS